jgi:hypothetical protein
MIARLREPTDADFFLTKPPSFVAVAARTRSPVASNRRDEAGEPMSFLL